MSEDWIDITELVGEALGARKPVVALESTAIAHGLPFPENIETAIACEEAVKRAGATPATIGIIKGRARIGLSSSEIELLAKSAGTHIEKVGLNNLASVLHAQTTGATTVAASLRLANFAGIRVFSTGGIGGVHRGASESFDISADMTALASTAAICVCSGAKAILDLSGTIEYLETSGVPVLGYQTSEFPAFYSRQSGLKVDFEVTSAADVARIARLHWETGSSSSVLVGVPVPATAGLQPDEVERAVSLALEMAATQGVRGKAVTPFVLAQMKELTGGRSLFANRALLVNNAEVAGQIASCLLVHR